MGKVPETQSGFDLNSTVAQIAAIIADEVGGSDPKRTDQNEAGFIVTSWLTPLGTEGMFAEKKEIENLEQLLVQTKRLRMLWDKIDRDARLKIKSAAKPDRHVGPRGLSRPHTTEQDILQFLSFGQDILSDAIPKVIAEIRAADQIGKRDYPAIRAFDACQIVWKRRKGEDVKSASHADFANFVERVFECLGINNSVEATAKSWRQIR